MRDWRSALQSKMMRNIVLSMFLLDAAGIYAVHYRANQAVDDDLLLQDAPAVATNTQSDFLPAPLPRPQPVARIEFSEVPPAKFDRLAAGPALSFEEFRPEPLDLARDQSSQPIVRKQAARQVQLAVSRSAPAVHRPTTEFATAFPGMDTMATEAPSPAVGQVMQSGSSPTIVSKQTVYIDKMGELPSVAVDNMQSQAETPVDGQADLDAQSGDAPALNDAPDFVPQDTANDPEPQAELPA